MTDDDQSIQEKSERIADEFDRDRDPLQEFEDSFDQLESDGVDPFEIYLEENVRGVFSDSTVDEYERAYNHFKSFMERQGRHPACPNRHLIKEFARQELKEKGNKKSTVTTKLQKLNIQFESMQNKEEYPHDVNFNPFKAGLNQIESIAGGDNDEEEEKKEFPRISIEEMREALNEVTHIMKLAVIMMGLKLGMRQGEIRNIKLKEIHISNSELFDYYSSLGTHRRLDDRKNAIFIPSRFQRPGNKSKMPRVLPLDDEMRRVLTQYLLIRPDSGEHWLFLSQTNHDKIRNKDGLNRYWKEQLRPQFEYKDYHRELTSHFGRHWFTTYWKIDRDIPRENVQYMRGDKIGKSIDRDGLDDYLHQYYESIEDLYREEIYKLLR